MMGAPIKDDVTRGAGQRLLRWLARVLRALVVEAFRLGARALRRSPAAIVALWNWLATR